jgi:hypothetical protein
VLSRWRRGRLGAAPVEVSIDADRCLNGLVAEVLLDDRQRDAGDDHPGGTGVSEVVNARRLRQPSGDGLAAGGFPAAVEELPPTIVRTNRGSKPGPDIRRNRRPKKPDPQTIARELSQRGTGWDASPLSGLSARCGVFSVSLSVVALTIQSFSWARGAGGRQRDRSHR